MSIPLIIGASSQKRSGRPFIIKVNYASAFTVTLPLYNAAGYNYNFIVNWGDGAVGQVTSSTDANRIHAYASGGTYTITMTGTLEGWTGNATGLKEYITEVTQWGRTGFKNVTMQSCTRLVSCYGKLITSQTSFQSMFLNDSALISCDVSEWDVSLITNFGSGIYRGMFTGCSNLISLDTSAWIFNSSSNIYFSGVFSNCSKLTTIGNTASWNTAKFYSLNATFYGCGKLASLNTSNWNISNVYDFSYLFYNCQSLTELDTSNWEFNSSSNFTLAVTFYNCVKLTTIGDTGKQSSGKWNLNKCTSLGTTFYGCSLLDTLDVSKWDVSNVTALNSTFGGCSSLTTLDVSDWNVSKVTTFGNGQYDGTFRACSQLTLLDISNWVFCTTSNITFAGVFNGCSGLTTLTTNGGYLVTDKFTTLTFAFYMCTSLTALDTSNWDVSNVSNMSFCFTGIRLSTLSVSNWNTGNCTSFVATFQGARITSLNVSNWNVSKVTAFDSMYYGCGYLTSLDLSSWSFSTTATSVSLTNMFSSCGNITSIGNVSGWTMTKVLNLSGIFYHCDKLTTIDTSGWDTSGITNCSNAFAYCGLLTSSFLNIKWWNRSPAIGTYTACFKSSINISNYADIPAGWK